MRAVRLETVLDGDVVGAPAHVLAVRDSLEMVRRRDGQIQRAACYLSGLFRVGARLLPARVPAVCNGSRMTRSPSNRTIFIPSRWQTTGLGGTGEYVARLERLLAQGWPADAAELFISRARPTWPTHGDGRCAGACLSGSACVGRSPPSGAGTRGWPA